MKKINLFLTLFSLFCLINVSFAQSRCGSQIRHQQLLHTDALYARQWQQFTIQSDRWMQEAQSRTDGSGCAGGTITIPVVIHFEYNAPESEKACIIALANSQIDHLNQAYNGTLCNDPSGTQSSSGGCVRFVIANKNHPASAGLTDGQQAILFNSDPCPNIANVPGAGTSEQEDYQTCAVTQWAGYLNLVIKFKLQNGTLGISSFPPEASIALSGAGAQNSVIISSCTFGLPNGASPCSVDFTGGASCVNEFAVNQGGTTATHEVGHFFGLPHTFCRDGSGEPTNVDSNGSLADGEGCQNDDICADGCQTTACDCDGIADTPAQAYAQFGCPGGSSNGTAANPSTPGTDYTYNNFMDYVDDNCMQCFSTQQATRIMNRSRDAANMPKGDVFGETPSADNCPDGSAIQAAGAACDDGDMNTTNDVIQADGCTCKGTGNTENPSCKTPSEPTVQKTRWKSVRLDWDRVSGAKSYTIQIRFKGMDRWILTATFRFSRISVSGPVRAYEYRIRSNCENGSSAYSPVYTFAIMPASSSGNYQSEAGARNSESEEKITIPESALDNYQFLALSPNPANNDLQVNYNYGSSSNLPTTMTVYDLTGRTILSKVVDGSQKDHRLDISDLPNGLYHLMLRQGNTKPLIKKFVKKRM